MRRETARLARRVSDDIAAEQRPVNRIVVKVRYAPFHTRTHGHSLSAPTIDPQEIEARALAELAQFSEHCPVRLLGVCGEFSTHPQPGIP